MQKKLMEILGRITDPVIALSTLSNVVTILVLVEILNKAQADNCYKIGTIIITILVQFGIMKTPNSKS